MKDLDDNQSAPVLIIEDSFADYESIIRAFQKLGMKNPVYHCETGEEALDYLHFRKSYSDSAKAPRPGVILLDLNLPGTDGRDILKEIKSDAGLHSIPVVILTTSDSGKDVEECYQNGANSYMTKPVSWEKFLKAIEAFKNYWLETVVLPVPLTV